MSGHKHTCQGDHDHDDTPEMGLQYSLYNKIDTGNLECLNERVEGSGKDVFKAWEERLNFEKVYKNRPHMTFDDTSIAPDQEFDLHPDNNGTLEYATKVVKFSSVTHLTLHFPKNFGGETTKIYYIGLRGEFTEGHRHGVTICTYEARPNVSDHKTDLMENISHEIQ
ncbi:PITH domain-containing protein [Gryllus bimaculatus]|nr:PITH domain-containing protein [Gryllus bimaculatus]